MLLERFEKWTQRASWWFVDKVEIPWLDIAKYQPLKGSSNIDLPKKLKDKKAIIKM